MVKSKILKDSADYFTDKVQTYGASPRGVDYNGDNSQLVRFQQILKVIPEGFDGAVNDLGCGYGRLFELLHETGFKGKYLGYDISKEMVLEGEKYLSAWPEQKPEIHLISETSDMKTADFTVASGIFNLKLHFSDQEWAHYILGVLEIMNAKSARGFSFNALTSYSDSDKRRGDLYYADPCQLFDFCKKNFSRNVALLHDYDLYDFTILVRK